MASKMSSTARKAAKRGAKQVLFIQGAGEGTHDEWDNKLVASLQRGLGPGHDVRYPRMPNGDDPSFVAWSAALEKEIVQLDDGAILIGHSVGGTILIHALTEQPKLLRGVAAICLIAAPFVGDGGWPADDIVLRRDWTAPLADIAVYLYQGDTDETTPMTHLDLYARPSRKRMCAASAAAIINSTMISPRSPKTFVE